MDDCVRISAFYTLVEKAVRCRNCRRHQLLQSFRVQSQFLSFGGEHAVRVRECSRRADASTQEFRGCGQRCASRHEQARIPLAPGESSTEDSALVSVFISTPFQSWHLH